MSKIEKVTESWYVIEVSPGEFLETLSLGLMPRPSKRTDRLDRARKFTEEDAKDYRDYRTLCQKEYVKLLRVENIQRIEMQD